MPHHEAFKIISRHLQSVFASHWAGLRGFFQCGSAGVSATKTQRHAQTSEQRWPQWWKLQCPASPPRLLINDTEGWQTIREQIWKRWRSPSEKRSATSKLRRLSLSSAPGYTVKQRRTVLPFQRPPAHSPSSHCTAKYPFLEQQTHKYFRYYLHIWNITIRVQHLAYSIVEEGC